MNNGTIVKRNRVAKKYKIIFSLDLHTENIYIYAINTRSGEVLHDTNVTGGLRSVLKRLRQCGPPKDIMVIAEIGNMGYAPQRFFARHGYPCELISPGSIPRTPMRQKTDRDDAMDNLEYYMNGQSSTVWIPEAQDEDVRDLLRHRHSLVPHCTKVKQRINALLKRKGLEYTKTKSRWCKTHVRWLETVDVSDDTRYLLDCLLAELADKSRLLEQITDRLKVIFSGDRYRECYQLYLVLKGIGPVTAMTLLIEFGDMNRFAHPSQVMKYIGIIPKKHSSGGYDPHLPITKKGNKYLRTACIWAARHYNDRRLLYSKKALEKLPETLRLFVTRCQNRLYGRYKHLTNDLKKPAFVARTAVGRELSGFLWELMVKVRPSLPAECLAQ